MKNEPDFSPTELEILRVLWEDSPLKPAEIEAAMTRLIENATLRSTLVALVEGGVLKREKQGKAYFYSPARKARTVRRKLTDQLASVFARGSRMGLIAQLIQDEKLTPTEIKELKKLARGNDDQ